MSRYDWQSKRMFKWSSSFMWKSWCDHILSSMLISVKSTLPIPPCLVQSAEYRHPLSDVLEIITVSLVTDWQWDLCSALILCFLWRSAICDSLLSVTLGYLWLSALCDSLLSVTLCSLWLSATPCSLWISSLRLPPFWDSLLWDPVLAEILSYLKRSVTRCGQGATSGGRRTATHARMR